MDRFDADSSPRISVDPIKSAAAVVIIILQLSAVASGSPGILPDLHGHPVHHRHPTPGYEYPVRWTRLTNGQNRRRPVNVMTDVVNDLGVKILERYIENDGNVGFSPSGLGFVLVALYEGSAGTSSRQIGETLGLPSDRRVTRIGFRDIHRRLRSYLNADAFLGGLTLNRDDINLRDDYEDVLRFYGFDISDSGDETMPRSTTGAISLTETTPPSTISTNENSTTFPITTESSIVDSTTIDTTVEIITNTTINRNSLTSITEIASTTTNSPTTNATTNFPTTNATTNFPTTTTTTNFPMTNATTNFPTTTTTNFPTTNVTTSRSVGPVDDATMGNITTIVSTSNSSSSNVVGDFSVTTIDPTMITNVVQTMIDNANASVTTATMQRIVESPMTNFSVAAAVVDGQTQSFDGSSVSMGTSGSDNVVVGTSMMTIVTMPMAVMVNESVRSTENSQRRSFDESSIIENDDVKTNPVTVSTDFTTMAMGNLTMGVGTNFTSAGMYSMGIVATDFATVPVNGMTTTMTTMTEGGSDLDFSTGNDGTMMDFSTMGDIDDGVTTMMPDAMTNTVRKRRSVLQGPSGYFSSSADDSIWLDVFGRLNNNDDYESQDDDIVENPNSSIELDFLINGCDYSRVTAATYTAILPFAHFSSLRTSLLEFPLDDPRYKILVMLPSEANGTRRLARILSSKSITIRHLRRSLQPTWVTAIIPSFMLRGFVTLTPYLQKLGIVDVFEPRTADLSPMSPDLGVYARDIQQSIGVNIRNNKKGGIGGAGSGDENQQRQAQTASLARGTRGIVGVPPFLAAGGPISPRSIGSIHYSPYPGGAGPVPFVVDRPFLYFIIDDQTSVSLLAGRIDDPLNSRIAL